MAHSKQVSRTALDHVTDSRGQVNKKVNNNGVAIHFMQATQKSKCVYQHMIHSNQKLVTCWTTAVPCYFPRLYHADLKFLMSLNLCISLFISIQLI